MTRGKERQRAEESGSLESMVFSKDFAPQNAARHRLRRGEQCQAADILIGLGRTPEGEVAVDRIVVHYCDQLCVFAQHELQDLYARCVSKACRRVRKEGSDDRYRHQRARITRHRVDRGVAGDWRHRLDMVQNRRQRKRHVPVSTATVSKKLRRQMFGKAEIGVDKTLFCFWWAEREG